MVKAVVWKIQKLLMTDFLLCSLLFQDKYSISQNSVTTSKALPEKPCFPNRKCSYCTEDCRLKERRVLLGTHTFGVGPMDLGLWGEGWPTWYCSSGIWWRTPRPGI